MTGHILALDDEADVRALICRWLRAEGLRCSPAGTAEEAIGVVEADPVDVALVDLRLGDVNGLSAAKQLREGCADLALVLVTGVSSFDAAVEGMRLGVLDYLLKPFTRRELLSIVQKALEWREAGRSAEAERRRLETEIERRSKELSEVFGRLEVASASALDALLVTLNLRSPDVFLHAKRVARMAVALGRGLGLTVPAITDVERGALLHDIGKIAMPDMLIRKPGPLTEAEMAIIRTHPQIGHDIVAVVPALRPAAEIVLASHERYDGTGYPRGLSRAAIPIGARVTAVVDAFDVLTSTREYRDPVSAEAAGAELVRCAGAQFDPDMVRVWLRLVESMILTSEWWPAAAEDAEAQGVGGKVA